jgi:hypothetical protein
VKVIQTADSKLQHKIFPFAENDTPTSCTSESELVIAQPSSDNNAVIWFEDKSTRNNDAREKKLHLQTDFRVIVWINSKKFTQSYSDIPMLMQREIIKHLDSLRVDSVSPAMNVVYSLTNIPEVYPALISKWSFDEKLLGWPYNYFAMDFKATYVIAHNCDSTLTLSEDACN